MTLAVERRGAIALIRTRRETSRPRGCSMICACAFAGSTDYGHELERQLALPEPDQPTLAELAGYLERAPGTETVRGPRCGGDAARPRGNDDHA